MNNNNVHTQIWYVVYVTKNINPSLVKPKVNFNGGLGKLRLTSFMK